MNYKKDERIEVIRHAYSGLFQLVSHGLFDKYVDFIDVYAEVRVRSKINLHFQVSRRQHGKARGGRITSYLTDEQRSHAGWIGASKCEVVFEQALSRGIGKVWRK